MSLPFIEKSNQRYIDYVSNLIDEEIQSLQPQEHEAPEIASKPRSLSAIDTTRYSNPSSDNELQIALQYALWRKENLEALHKHGKNSWLIGNEDAANVLKRLQNDLQHAKDSIAETNKDRERAQQYAKPTLDFLEKRYHEAIRNLVELGIRD